MKQKKNKMYEKVFVAITVAPRTEDLYDDCITALKNFFSIYCRDCCDPHNSLGASMSEC